MTSPPTLHDPGAEFLSTTPVHPHTMQPEERPAESAPAAPARVRSLPAAERRQLTILFCDLVGSTELSEQLDPEVLHEIVQAYHRACTAAVNRYEGTIAHILGDGVVVMFGFPEAHEDDAERAVRCGCEMLQRIAALPHRPALQARVGIHTGAVVIGEFGDESGRSQILPMSLTSNLASRLQAHADPNALLITQATMKLVPGLFVTRTLPPAVLKGIEKPVPVYQVLQPSGVHTRLEAASALTPFVGREAEVTRLLQGWQLALQGCGQAALIVGEAGQGKSRLLLTLRQALGDVPHAWLDCRASPLSRNSAFQPLIDLLQRSLGLPELEGDELRLARLESALDALDEDRAEAVPLIAPLLNLPVPASRYAASPYSASLRRSKTLRLLAHWLARMGAGQPFVLAFEDLHWADSSSLEVLRQLVANLSGYSVLLLLSARPEFVPAWGPSATINIALNSLPAGQCRRMLANLAGNRALPEVLQQRIVERTNGVPLFLEEVTKQILESGQLEALAGRLDDISIPETLQDSLMARLDRLGPAREVAQVASVVGREVPLRLLSRLPHRDERLLARDLEQLVQAGLLFQRAETVEPIYVFKHALIQDAAYNSLLKTTRQQLHGAIARAIEHHFPERAQSEPGLVAEHFEKAGLLEPAVRFHRAAAHRAASKVADKEAIQHSERALRLLSMLPSSPARNAVELDIVLTLARCQVNQFGYGSEAAGRNLSRARMIATGVADHAVRYRTTIELFLVNNGLARFGPALELADELRVLATRSGHLQERLGGIVTSTMVHLAKGAPARAMQLLEEVEPPCDAATALSSLSVSPMVHAVVRLIFKSWVEWLLGFPDRAQRTCEAATRLAQECRYAPTIAHTLALGPTFLALRIGKPEQVPGLCAQLRDWTDRFGLVLWGSYADLLEGVARCQLGDFGGSIRSVFDCIARRRAIGSRLWQTMFFGMLAEQCLRGGFLNEAEQALTSGFEAHHEHSEDLWLAELHRLDGELRWARSRDAAGAKESFERALEVARSQQARSFELRAATSLARLAKDCGDATSGAHEVLAAVYAAFTEGFGTRDLVDARELLDAAVP